MTSGRTFFLLRFFLFAALKGEGRRRRMEWSQRGRALLTTISAPPLKFSKVNTSSQNSTTFLRTFYKRILEPIYWNSYESFYRTCRLPIYFIYMDRSSIWVRYSIYLHRYCYILEQPSNILSHSLAPSCLDFSAFVARLLLWLASSDDILRLHARPPSSPFPLHTGFSRLLEAS